MPSLLGRIERDYVFRSIENEKTSLTIFTELSNVAIPPVNFVIHSGRIEFSCDSSFIEQYEQPKDIQIPCRVRFAHQDKYLVFFTILAISHTKKASMMLPPQLWRETDDSAAFPVLRMLRDDAFFISFACPQMHSPFLSISERSALSENHDVNNGILQLIGLKPEDKGPSVRFLSSIENYKNKQGLYSGTFFPEILIFIDHEHIVLFAQRSAASALADRNISFQMDFSARKILFRAKMVAKLDLNRINCMFYLQIDEVQEEDRRFLFESCYGTRYI